MHTLVIKIMLLPVVLDLPLELSPLEKEVPIELYSNLLFIHIISGH